MIKCSDHVCRKSRFLETCDSVPCVWCSVTKLVLVRSEPHNILVLVCIFLGVIHLNESKPSIAYTYNIFICVTGTHTKYLYLKVLIVSKEGHLSLGALTFVWDRPILSLLILKH